jgi:hypothetical protein
MWSFLRRLVRRLRRRFDGNAYYDDRQESEAEDRREAKAARDLGTSFVKSYDEGRTPH